MNYRLIGDLKQWEILKDHLHKQYNPIEMTVSGFYELLFEFCNGGGGFSNLTANVIGEHVGLF